jgi:hypothetical protein
VADEEAAKQREPDAGGAMGRPVLEAKVAGRDCGIGRFMGRERCLEAAGDERVRQVGEFCVLVE